MAQQEIKEKVPAARLDAWLKARNAAVIRTLPNGAVYKLGTGGTVSAQRDGAGTYKVIATGTRCDC